MTKEQAISILKSVLDSLKLTAPERDNLNAALQIAAYANPAPQKIENPKKD